MEFSNILVSIDLSRKNTQLIKFCFELAKNTDSKLNFLHCFHPSLDDKGLDVEQLEKKHLYDLVATVENCAISYESVDYGCFTQSSFATDGILESINEGAHDLLILAASQSNTSMFGSGLAYDLLDKTSIPVIIVPDLFRYVDMSHILFNLEFEFREIEKIYDLLILCDMLGANLSCLHVCNKAEAENATRNIEVYKRMFEGHVLESMIDFELFVNDKLLSIDKFAIDNEADLLVLGKTRKTWKHQYRKTAEQKLGENISIPLMVIDI